MTYLDPPQTLWQVSRALGGLLLIAASTVLVVILGYHAAGGIGILVGLIALSAMIPRTDT